MLMSQEQGNRLARDVAIMSEPNVLHVSHPLQGKALTLKSHKANLAFIGTINTAHCSMDAIPF